MMLDKNQPKSSESFLKTLNLMYLAFLSSQSLVVVAAFLSRQDAYFNLQDDENVYMYIVPAFALAGFFVGRILFRKGLNDIAAKGVLSEKLAAYTSLFLVRVALTEAPTLFAAVAFFLTGNFAFLIVGVLMILYFLTLRPHRETVEKDLGLKLKSKEFGITPQVLSTDTTRNVSK